MSLFSVWSGKCTLCPDYLYGGDYDKACHSKCAQNGGFFTNKYDSIAYTYSYTIDNSQLFSYYLDFTTVY